MPRWWITDDPILDGRGSIDSEAITQFVYNSDRSLLLSRFKLYPVTLSDGSRHPYWDPIEIREFLASDHPEAPPGPPNEIVRARIIFPRGKRRIKEQDKVSMLEMAFENWAENTEDRERGVEFEDLTCEDLAIYKVRNIRMGPSTQRRTLFCGHVLEIEQRKIRMTFVLKKLPPYDEVPDIQQSVVVVFCFRRGSKVDISTCPSSTVADALLTNWNERRQHSGALQDLYSTEFYPDH